MPPKFRIDISPPQAPRTVVNEEEVSKSSISTGEALASAPSQNNKNSEETILKNFGPTIKLIQRNINNTKVVIRKFISGDGGAQGKAAREFEHLRTFAAHPNLIRYIKGVKHRNSDVEIDMEFADAGQIDYIAALYPLSSAERRTVVKSCARQLFSALTFCTETLCRCHRDVQPSNCLLRFDGVMKLADFAVSKSTVNDSNDNNNGLNWIEDASRNARQGVKEQDNTVVYMAPEMRLTTQFNPMLADVWSAGITLFEILDNVVCLTNSSMFFAPDMSHVAALNWKLVADSDPALEYVLRKCLQTDPRNRCSLIDAMAMTLILQNPLQQNEPADVWKNDCVGTEPFSLDANKKLKIELCDGVIAANRCFPPSKLLLEEPISNNSYAIIYNEAESTEVYNKTRAVAQALRKEFASWRTLREAELVQSPGHQKLEIDTVMTSVWKQRNSAATQQLQTLLNAKKVEVLAAMNDRASRMQAQDSESSTKIPSSNVRIDDKRIIQVPCSRSSPQWVIFDCNFLSADGRTISAAAKVYLHGCNAPLARYEAQLHAAASKQNPHLVRILGTSTCVHPTTSETLAVLLLEKPTTTLELALQHGKLSTATIRRLAHQILEGIEIRHKEGSHCLVRNLAASNIFIINNDAKIASLVPDINSIETPPPEYFGFREEQFTPTQESDIFSFGVLLLRMLVGVQDSKCLLRERAIDAQFIQENAGTDPSRFALLEICAQCLQDDPSQRPSISSLLQKLDGEIKKCSNTDEENISGSSYEFDFNGENGSGGEGDGDGNDGSGGDDGSDDGGGDGGAGNGGGGGGGGDDDDDDPNGQVNNKMSWLKLLELKHNKDLPVELHRLFRDNGITSLLAFLCKPNSDVRRLVSNEFIGNVALIGDVLEIHKSLKTLEVHFGRKLRVLPFSAIRVDTLRLRGKGAQGTVFESTLENNLCAAKQFKENDSAIRDIETLLRYNHPNIMKCFAATIDPNTSQIILISELADCSLSDLLQWNLVTPLNLRTIHSFASQIATGLEHIHNRGCLHCDLKPANLLVFRDVVENSLIIKHCDFGFSAFSRGCCAFTPSYMCIRRALALLNNNPNALRDPPIVPSFDSYSFGVALVELLHHPSPGVRLAEVRREIPRLISEGKYEPVVPLSSIAVFLEKMSEAKKPAFISASEPHAFTEFGALVRDCLMLDPESRPESGKELSAQLALLKAELTDEAAQQFTLTAPPVVLDDESETAELPSKVFGMSYECYECCL